MKKSSFFFVSILILLGLAGCGSKEDSSSSENSSNSEVKTYSSLPNQNDLSYFAIQDNIFSYYAYNYPTAFVVQSFSGDKRIALNLGVFPIEIRNKDVGEFYFDDYVKNITEKYNQYVEKIKSSYGSAPEHIRITNLNIPAKFDADGWLLISKEDYESKMLSLGFVEEIDMVKKGVEIIGSENEKFIKKRSRSYGAIMGYSDYQRRRGIIISSEKEFISTIGKANKGNATITELTLKLSDVSKSEEAIVSFEITSFKLKHSDKRFVKANDNSYVPKDNNVEI